MTLLCALGVVCLGSGVAVGAPPSTAIRYVYDPDGHLKAVTLPGSETALYSWDAAGNLTSIALKQSKSLSIVQLAPAQGAVGETVTINGTGFSTKPSSDTVKFNGTAATVSAASEWALTVTVPKGATSGAVSVQTTEGPVTSVQKFTIVESAAPELKSLSESVAVASSTITATGANLESIVPNDITKVNQNIAEVQSASTSSLQFKVPENTGSGHVTVVTPEGTAVGPDLYIPPEGMPVSKVESTGSFSLGGSGVTLKLPEVEKVGLGAFEGVAGERVSITGTESTIFSGLISVWGPQNNKVYEGGFTKEAFIEPFTLPSTGTYTVMIFSYDYTGSMTLHGYSVKDVTGSIAPSTEGTETPVSLPTPGQNARYAVKITAGEAVSLKVSGATFGSNIDFEWLNSEGIRVGNLESTGTGEFLGSTKFTTSGTYTLVVNPPEAATGSLTLTAYEASDVTGSLTLGEQKKFTVSVPGQVVRATFPGSNGERISVTATEATTGATLFSILNPEGEKTYENGFNKEGFIEPVTLKSTGTYTLLVTPQLGYTGSVTLGAYSVKDVTGSIVPTTAGAETLVSLPTPGQNARYAVKITGGEAVSLKVSGATFGSSIDFEWLNSEGARVGNLESTGTGQFIGSTKFTTAGTYTLVVNPPEAAVGSLTLTAYEASDVTGSLTLGEQKKFTISTPGQIVRANFSATSGEHISVTATESTTGETFIRILNPEGTKIYESSFSGEGFIEPIAITASGTYTLVVEPLEARTGSMALTAYSVKNVEGSIIAGGEPKKVALKTPGQIARITFSGTAEQLLTLKMTEVTSNFGTVSVLTPGESRLLEANIGEGAKEEFTPSTTGTYTILVEPYGHDTGSLTLTLYKGSHPGALARPASLSTPKVAAVMPGGLDSAAHAAKSLGLPAPASQPHRAIARPNRRRLFERHSARVFSPRRDSSITPQMDAFCPVSTGVWNPPRRRHTGRSGSWESLQPPTPWTQTPALQGLEGVTALAGQVLAGDGLPLARVRLAVEGTYVATQTDSEGRFLLSGLPAGRQVLVVEGDAVPGGKRYGRYETGVELTANRTTTLQYTIWLTPLDPAGDYRIASPIKHEVRLRTPQIPGLEVVLPAGSVITNAAWKVVHDLNITAIPTNRPPFPLPAFVSVPVYFTVQPGGAWPSKGAQIIYPNWDHLPPGQRVEFWNYEASKRGWYIYGEGTVTPNGKQVVPDPNVRVWDFSGAMISSTPTPPANGPKGGNPTGGDPVDLQTGLYVYRKTDLTIPDTIPIVIEHTYRQDDSNSYAFGIGAESFYEMRLWSNNNYHEADLVLPNGGRVHYVRISPGTGYPEAVYESTNVPGPYYASTIRWNTNVGEWELTLTDGMTYVFGEFAPLQAIRDRYGNQLTITREGGKNGNITQITSPHGRWVRFGYDSSNRIIEVTDNGGRQLKYTYVSGLLSSVTDAAGHTTKYEYTASNQLKSVTDGRGKKYVETEYEANGRVAKQTLGDGGTYSFAYTLKGEQVETATITDPRKIQSKTTFNSEGYPTSQVMALGTAIQQTTTYEPEVGTGLSLSTTDPRGQKTAFKYDKYGNATQITRLAGTESARTENYTYESGTNELAAATNALTQTTKYQHGTDGELLSVTDPLGHKTSYEYDAEGQPTAITNALENTTKLAYENGLLVSITDPLGRRTTRFLDSLGRVVTVTRPGGQVTHYEYGADNEIAKITDPLGAATNYEYDGDGDLTATTDSLGHKSTAGYDPMDRLESETDALGHATKALYDGDGNIIQITDRRGKVSKFTYDYLNRLTEARYGVSGETAESTITYGYDNGNRLTKIVDSATGTYTLEYDELNRLKSITTPTGTITYAYNEAEERTSMTAPEQEALKYTYDAAGRLTELKRGSETITFAYNAANLPTATKLTDGIEERYGYDEANELTSIAYKNGSTTLGELDYSYEPDGRREAVWGSLAGTALPEAITAATYNADNEQTKINGTKLNTTKLGYDLNGNLTEASGAQYKWNARNQLAAISGATTASFAYDPFGRRTSKTIAGTTTKDLFDGPNVIQEIIGSSTTNLVTGLRPDSILARIVGNATESYLTDALGSTIGLANSGAKIQTKYLYDPFGNTKLAGTASENPYQFAGRENDDNGLYYNRARYYSPTDGRFISQDPLGRAVSGPNLYLYTNNSPTNATDPFGTTEEPWNTLPRGEGERVREIENEENGRPPGAGSPPPTANLNAPNGSGGWINVICQATTPIKLPGIVGAAVTAGCGFRQVKGAALE
jgi:RHS repeat-associated protein